MAKSKKAETETGKKEFIRFKENSLLMLSRKNMVSGKIGYFSFKMIEPAYKKDLEDANASGKKDIGFAFSMNAPPYGFLERGVPILVYETPIRVERKYAANSYHWQRDKNKKYFFWQIKFLLEEQLCVMFLTDTQYNHELVRAVPARITKDYSLAKATKATK